jgi:hypothetical protein
MQREGTAERKTFEHRLSIPPNQWNDDQVQARAYYGISRIATQRRWRRKVRQSAKTQTWSTAPIFALTVATR